MGFLGIYSAVYDYQPQGEGELEIREGDLLYILEKSEEDDWWKAKKKAEQDDEDEPEGLVPNNYVEEVSFTALGAQFIHLSCLNGHLTRITTCFGEDRLANTYVYVD